MACVEGVRVRACVRRSWPQRARLTRKDVFCTGLALVAAAVVLYFLSGMAQVYRCYVACNAVLLYSRMLGAGALCRCWRCTCARSRFVLR